MLAAIFALGAVLSFLIIPAPPHPILWAIGSIAFTSLGIALERRQKAPPPPADPSWGKQVVERTCPVKTRDGTLDQLKVGCAQTAGPSGVLFECPYGDPFSKGHAFAIIHGGFTPINGAEWIESNLTGALSASFEKENDPPQALTNVFINLDKRFQKDVPGQEATLILAVKIGTDLWTANIGTCCAIFVPNDGAKFQLLSKGIVLSDKEYQKEVLEAGGILSEDQGLLLVDGSIHARSIGMRVEPKNTSCQPKVTQLSIKDQAGILLLFSPGLYLQATPEQIADEVYKLRLSPSTEIAQALVKKAQQAGSILNITALVVKL